ncbi:hypothetical protein Ctob_010372 [Chrysochromulina tobinii]|uniref:Uncharacterized protein n=1 Tax=Chrysochromulina tobinii TaxID=1460289 RepID=A0A0M0JT95_9EUKA|nr:hypothetical protein Ctob_010372 [Chrysochromulina tobinii]|eukprot:KOO29507.1 hypothetical protein Ctob_010372 [Chrysochromulina sp. CCMP291]
MPSLNSPRSKALSAASPSKANSAITLTKPISAAPAASPPQPTGFGLRLELQQEQLVELTREADTLRAELDEVRQRHAQADAVREHERGELVASYERMLSEQAAAVRQYESRCACVGSLRLEARKRDAELSAVRTESAAVRQRLTVVSKVWRQSVLELESCLEREIRERHQLEAERAKSNEMQRKRLQSLQREADARAAEAKKMAEREEIAVHQAVQQATKQAERAFESKAKEIKREANDSLRKERSSHQVQLARAVDEAERERERLVEDAIANLAEVRREADEALRHRMAMHAHQLLGLQREQCAAERCVGAELTALEVELEAAHAATAQAQAAAKAAADAASQTIASLKGVEKDLRAQLKGVREAHSALEKEHAKLQQTAYQEKTALCEAHTASLAAAKKEADEARKQLADELKGVKETLERMEGEVTKACQLRFEAERAKRLEGELRALTTALDASAEEVRQMEQAMVAAVVAQRLRLDVEIQKEVERIAVADALRSALEAEEKVKSLRAEVRAAEAALGAARAAASHEKAAAELAASALTTAQKEADERLERALHEAATQAKSALLTEKSKAQAESRKAIARAEREAEERLLAQRDDFGKQEKGLREKIVELQKDLTAARQRAAKVEGSAQGGAHGGAPSAEPSHSHSHRQPSPGRGGGDSSARGAVPGSARSVDAEPSARGGAVAKRHGSPARGQAGAQNGLRVEREEAASLAAGALTLHNATLAVLLREMISLEGESAEEAAAADRLRERLAMETKHLQRKHSRVTKESEQKMADERAALESRLQETERRSEARLRAERTRLAVRYGNQGKQVVQEKLTEKLESLGYNGDGGASPALSSRRSLSPGR